MGATGFGDEIGQDDDGSNAGNGDVRSGDKGDDAKGKGKTDEDSGHPPSWSEMKTKAGKERKRLPLACIACRRKKIRCSGEKPACKHCLRSRIPCVYKVTARKAAPRTDYMAMLDKRLKRMEDRVIKLIPKESLSSISGITRAVVKPPIAPPPPKTPANKKRPAEEAFGAELDDWSKTKATNPSTSATQSTSKAPETDENKLLTEGLDCLPSKEIQEHLAEVYFDYVYGQSYPLLHKPSFMRRLNAGQVPPVLILAVCAISARFSTHPQVRTEPAFLRGEHWARKAEEISRNRYDIPNITILIVYLLLGLHYFGTCQGGKSWMLGGMAQRMAYALQLHKDLDHDPLGEKKGDRAELGFTDREIRRRTMWSCFLMDRFNSSGTERPIFVDAQFIQVQLPIKEHCFQMEIPGPTEDLEGQVRNPVPSDAGQLSNAQENMGVVAYTVRAVAIWGRMIKYHNLGGKEKETGPMWSQDSEFHKLRDQAQSFKASLPARLQWNPENLQSHITERTANQFIFLHIIYHQLILVLNRFALPSSAASRPPKDMPQQFFADCARSALESANQISILVEEATDHNVVVPFAGYCAFQSSTVHIRGVFSKNPKLEQASKRYLAYNVKYLTHMKKYWGVFHFLAENLKDLYRQHADAALRGPAAAGENKTSIFQYGDWFDRYPQGVSRTDFEDPAQGVKTEAGTDAVLGQKSDLQSVEEFFASLSPPSKAEAQSKRPRKGRHAKSASHSQPPPPTSAPNPSASTGTTTMQPSPSALQAPQLPQQHAHQLPQNLAPGLSLPHQQQQPLDPYNPNSFFSPHQNHAFPPDFAPDFSTLHQHPLTQLDRQMVLQSYANNAPAANLNPFNLDIGGLNTAMNLQGGAGAGGAGAAGGWGDPSTAWFMPFNMEPPEMVGDEVGIFGGQGYGFGFDGVGGASGGGGNGGLMQAPPGMEELAGLVEEGGMEGILGEGGGGAEGRR
ncbi:hypothetical protein K490DRAFT_32867 [Saccharata proteae CBS 121410]|uniref:Zn(2)-C6 fungal-type domain-containing protein n=1 Tax=Saccharata proteae CBS 121410 TaxID=1314787 RepID=A0A9P4I2E5_9PEZI|nr:hypothetical protein K490DRAFT_32867 [Saccharata proteae CBS 121410]